MKKNTVRHKANPKTGACFSLLGLPLNNLHRDACEKERLHCGKNQKCYKDLAGSLDAPAHAPKRKQLMCYC